MKKILPGLLAAVLLCAAPLLAAVFVDYTDADTIKVVKELRLGGTVRGAVAGPALTRVSATVVGMPGLSINGTTLTTTGTELNKLAGVVAGTVTASKAVVVGASKDIDTITVTGNLKTGDGVGAVAGTGVTLVDVGTGAVHKTIFTLVNVDVTVTDTGGANGGQGSLKIYDFPEGFITEIGCTTNITTARVSTGLATNAAVVEALGTVAPAADATLTGTEANWDASFAGTLSSGAGVWTANGAAVLAALDGHTTPVDLLVNVAVPDAGISASDTLRLNGTAVCVWSQTGDF